MSSLRTGTAVLALVLCTWHPGAAQGKAYMRHLLLSSDDLAAAGSGSSSTQRERARKQNGSSSSTWRLRNRNGSIDVAARVPGYAWDALQDSGIIRHDPEWRQV